MQNYFETTPPPHVLADFDYFRIPRERWELLLIRLKQMGSLALFVTVPWGFHEIEAGTVDLHGISNARRDLTGLLNLCQTLKLSCLLNLGPYTDQGVLGQGIPVWLLKQSDDLATTLLPAAKQWYKTLSQTVVGEQWPTGPIVALQVDNAVAGQSPALSSDLTEVKWPIWLRKRYQGIEALNEAYGTDYRTVSRVEFPETWANESTPLEREAKAFLAEMNADIQTNFSQLLSQAGWHLPIYGLSEKTPEIRTFSLLSDELPDLSSDRIIWHLQHPLQIDPDPADIGAGPSWADQAPIRADGAVRRKFWQVRHALWAQQLVGSQRDETFSLTTSNALIISAGADTPLKVETAASPQTPVYRLCLSGALVRDDSLKIARKKLSGTCLVEDEIGQTDFITLVQRPSEPLEGFLLAYLSDLLTAQIQALRHSATLATALGETLSFDSQKPTATRPTQPERPAQTSYILGEAKRGLRQADAALRRAMASIGELEGGFATILGKGESETAQAAPAPVAITPTAFEGVVRQRLVETGRNCAEIATQLQATTAKLQKVVDTSAGFTVAHYQATYQTAVEAARTARLTLLEMIAEFRLEIISEQLPLVVWRVHDQIEAIAENLRWGVLRGLT